MEPLDLNINSQSQPIGNDDTNLTDIFEEFTQKIDDEKNLSQHQRETRDEQKNAWKKQKKSKHTESNESLDQLSKRHQQYISNSKSTTQALQETMSDTNMLSKNTIESTGEDHLNQLFGS